jgi:hypothetical protein
MKEKREPLQQMLQGKMGICLQKTETRCIPVTLHNINPKWIKDLNVRPES